MSITQTYFLAHKARAKLSREAGQPDHNLRLLVGHANLLDSLMLDLAEAEREQESWFNQSVRGAAPKTEERHIQWADSIPTRNDADWEADDSSDSDSDSDLSEEEDEDDDVEDDVDDVEMADAVTYRRAPAGSVVPSSPQRAHIGVAEVDEDEEDIDALTLTRSPSHTAASPPPELDLDSDTSEDESMPPSPPFATLPTFSDKQRESAYYNGPKAADEEEAEKAGFYNEGYYIPQRNPTRLVSAISVY